MAISSHDITPDSPTNVFATLNPLLLRGGTLSDGNLKLSGGGNYTGSFATILIQRTGKWYVEVRTNDATDDHAIMIFPISEYVASAYATANGLYIPSYGSAINIATDTASTSLGSVSETATTSGDVLGYLIDVENGRVTITKNGVHKLTVTNWTSLDEEHYIGYNVITTWPAVNKTFNFGGDPTFGGLETPASSITDQNGYGKFLYAPVDSSNNLITDFKSLCTANLPDPAIDPNLDDLPEDYFKAVIWTGNNTGTSRTITVGFGSDLIWTKRRDGNLGTSNHLVYDSVRGAGNRLQTNTTASSSSNDIYGYINNIGTTSFTFTDGTDATYPRFYYNDNNGEYVAWCFRAGGAPSGSTSTTGSAKRINTSGTQDDTSCSALASAASATITPTLMSINQKAGFSIVKYQATNSAGGGAGTNGKIPHGLSKVPDMIIVKCTNGTDSWMVKHKSLSAGNYVVLNSSGGIGSTSNIFTNNSDTDDYFWVGTNNATNNSSQTYIAYCWHSVAGYSAFGSYTGNGSADGPFVYTGFKPAWVMVKNIDSTSTNWMIWDNARDTYNVTDSILRANTSDTQDDGTWKVDFLSNGVKILTANSDHVNNTLGDTYIYAAFAEQPFKYVNAR